MNRREREKAKKEKADAKRERRMAKAEAAASEPEVPREAVDEIRILDQLTALNAAFDAGELTFDVFDEQRAALLGMLRIE